MGSGKLTAIRFLAKIFVVCVIIFCQEGYCLNRHSNISYIQEEAHNQSAFIFFYR